MYLRRLQRWWWKQTPQSGSVVCAAWAIDSALTCVGSILVDGIAILVTLFLIWRSQRKKAAVGRRYDMSHTLQ
jgi:hypothetical protein